MKMTKKNVRTIIIFMTLLLVSVSPVKSQVDTLKLSSIKSYVSTEYDYLVTISTRFGNMKLILYDETPLHKYNFIHMAENGVYDGCLFHRVIDHFMIQGGNPYTKEQEPSEKVKRMVKTIIPPEIKKHITHVRGAIAMARGNDEKNPGRLSSGNQFYIVENHRGAHHLDGKYTVFGRVLSGLDTIDKIAEQKTNDKDKPKINTSMKVKIIKVKRSDVELFYEYKYKK